MPQEQTIQCPKCGTIWTPHFRLTVQCTNCGTRWAPDIEFIDQGVVVGTNVVCPVCQLPIPMHATPPKPIESISDLQTQLGALITTAHTSGLDPEAIISTLRDELAYNAELDHHNHHFYVQLIDLGPIESKIHDRPMRDRREIHQLPSGNR